MLSLARPLIVIILLEIHPMLNKNVIIGLTIF